MKKYTHDIAFKQTLSFFVLFAMVLCLFSDYSQQLTPCLKFSKQVIQFEDDDLEDLVYEQDDLVLDQVGDSLRPFDSYSEYLEVLSARFHNEESNETSHYYSYQEINNIHLDILLPPPRHLSC